MLQKRQNDGPSVVGTALRKLWEDDIVLAGRHAYSNEVYGYNMLPDQTESHLEGTYGTVYTVMEGKILIADHHYIYCIRVGCHFFIQNWYEILG